MNHPANDGCARVRARLPVAIDGGLTPLEEALDRGHLEACAGCRRERDEHLRLLASLRRAWPSDAVELERVEAMVLARVSEIRPPRRESAWLRQGSWAAALAAGLLLALLAALGTGSPLSTLDSASLSRFLERLPHWSDVVHGLDGLCQRVS